MYIVVFVTAKNDTEADAIASALVEKKLIACANIVAGVKSIFSWKGKTDKADEVLLMMKSQKNRFADIVQCVKAMHSYDIPEVIALPVVDGSKEYLDWVGDCCR